MFVGVSPTPAPVGHIKPLLSFLDPVTIALNTSQPKGELSLSLNSCGTFVKTVSYFFDTYVSSLTTFLLFL